MTRLTDAVRRASGLAPGVGVEPAPLTSPWDLEADAPALPAPPLAPAVPASVEPVPAARPRRRAPVAAAVLLAAAAGAGWYVLAPVSDALRIAGVIQANEAIVSATLTARMLELRVEEGDRVAAGDVVAVLDRAELEAERDRHAAAVRQLSAKLAQNRQLVTLESDRAAGRIAMAQAALAAAVQQRDQAAAELEQRTADAARARNLFEQGVVPRQDFERLTTDLRVAEAQLQARASAVTSADAELTLARAGTRQVDVAGSEVERTMAEIRQEEAQIAAVDARLAQTIVRAPLSGIVSIRVARQGEVIEAGRPIVTIIDDRDQWVLAAVDERDSNRVRLGAPMDVEFASGSRVTGTVTYVAAEAEFATRRDVSRARRDIRSVSFRVGLPPGTAAAHPGLTAYVHLPATESR
jgi:HlyD family secretion protein